MYKVVASLCKTYTFYIYKERILKQKHFKIEEKKWKKQKLK